MKNQPLKIAVCCLAGTIFTAIPAYNVMAAPSAGVSEYASAILESELNASSTSAGVSSAVADYFEKNIVSSENRSAEKADAEEKKSKPKKVAKEVKKSQHLQ